MKLRLTFLIAVTSLVAAAQVLPADDSAAVASPALGCTFVVGGGGTVIQDETINSRWLAINSVLTRNVVASLQKMNYRVTGFIAGEHDPDKRFAVIHARLEAAKCGKVLQISHALTTTPEKPNVITAFTFTASVFHLEPGASDKEFKVVGEYEKSYQFALNREAMEKLSLSKVGETIAKDIDQAKVLVKNE
jgi:hypothetical protein